MKYTVKNLKCPEIFIYFNKYIFTGSEVRLANFILDSKNIAKNEQFILIKVVNY